MKLSSLLLAVFFILTITSLTHRVQPVYARGNYAVPTVEEVTADLIEAADGVMHKEGSETNSTIVPQVVLGGEILGLPSDNPKNSLHYNRSAVAYMGNAIAYIYDNPPATTYAFAVDLGKTLGFLPRTYAQGFGFSGLSPLLGLWKIFRNIAYGIIAIIMIVIGFMVMLRKKIDPKTVVTVQNSIPRIVIALILVTFSYAIVGLMIDLMYVSMLLIANVLMGKSDSTLWGAVKFNLSPKEVVEANFLTTASAFLGAGWKSLVGLFSFVPTDYKVAGTIITGILGFIATGFGVKGALIGAAAPYALPFLVVALAVLIGIVRLFFLLLDAYIHIIIALLTSPFHLMMEAIPGTNSFSAWFRNLLGKLLVFPTVTALLLITFILTSKEVVGSVWGPPLLGGGLEGEGMAALIGLGMLLSIPTIVGGIQKSLKGEPLVPAGIGTIVGPLGSGISQLMNLYYQTTMIKAYSRKDHAPSTYQQGVTAAGQSPTSLLTGGGGQK